MGTGEEADVASDGHEGEVDPDELEIAVLMIKDAMARDLDFALGVMGGVARDNFHDLDSWAAAHPAKAVAMAEASDDFRNSDADFAKALERHGKAQRSLAEDAGYSRSVWHQPPGEAADE